MVGSRCGSVEAEFNCYLKKLLDLNSGRCGSGSFSGKRETDSNLDLVYRFLVYCRARNTALSNQSYYLRAIVNLLGFRYKDFLDFSRTDFEEYLQFVSSKWSQGTIYRLLSSTRAFFKWLHKGKHPEATEWIQLKKPANKILPEDLLSTQDITKLIDCCRNTRDKALIAITFDSCARPQELCNLKMADVLKNKDGLALTLHGSKGTRVIQLIDSVDLLQQWISFSGKQFGSDEWLWTTIGSNERLRYCKIDAQIRRIADRAKIPRTIFLYKFRHSGLTERAKQLTDQELKAYAGWRPASNMPNTYIHLTTEEVNKKLLARKEQQNKGGKEDFFEFFEAYQKWKNYK